MNKVSKKKMRKKKKKERKRVAKKMKKTKKKRRKKRRRKTRKMQMKRTTLSICISSAEINTKMTPRIKIEALLLVANSNCSLQS